MLEPIEDRNLTEIRPLVSPRALKTELPASARSAEVVRAGRRAIRDAIHGRDPRRLVTVVGPCSIHDREAALEYAERLRRVADALAGELVGVMRTYFEKPRTTVGWKGLVNDPHLDGSCDVAAGLRAARELLLEINERGLPCASELLDPFTPQFIADLLSWASIGARTAESQTHRQLASGLSMPVGIKNATDGRLDIAVNAMIAARDPHSFLGITADGVSAVVSTSGNPDRHLVLRGGEAGPNHDAASVAEAVERLAGQELARPVMVDCSHANSSKQPERQAIVCREVLRQLHAGRGGPHPLLGLMLESHLHAGAQSWKPGARLRYGVSITDACIGWSETEDLLHEIAEAVKVST